MRQELASTSARRTEVSGPPDKKGQGRDTNPDLLETTTRASERVDQKGKINFFNGLHVPIARSVESWATGKQSAPIEQKTR